jgi:hypothetical protein
MGDASQNATENLLYPQTSARSNKIALNNESMSFIMVFIHYFYCGIAIARMSNQVPLERG